MRAKSACTTFGSYGWPGRAAITDMMVAVGTCKLPVMSTDTIFGADADCAGAILANSNANIEVRTARRLSPARCRPTPKAIYERLFKPGPPFRPSLPGSLLGLRAHARV